MIEVDALSHRYGRRRVLAGLSLRIGAGEIVGLLGPNGAGKSTLLRLLATYLEPSEGHVRIAGRDSVAQALAARAALGYLPEHNALFESMRVSDYLRFVARIRGLEPALARQRTSELARRLDLGAVLQSPIRECSKGFRQRVGLAGVLLADPPVLILDEPTHGLDPLQVVQLRDFLHELSPGRAIVFSSHILAEVAAISTRLVLLHAGRILIDRPTAELRAEAAAASEDLEALVLRAVRERERAGSMAAEDTSDALLPR